MNAEQKKSIKSTILECRNILEKDIEQVLINYGVYVDKDWVNIRDLKNLSEEITYSIVKSDNGIYFGTSTSLMFYNTKNNSTSEVFSNKKEIYSIVDSNDFLTAASLSEVIIYEKKNPEVIKEISKELKETESLDGKK